MELAMIYFDG